MYLEKNGLIYRMFIKLNGKYIIFGSFFKGCVRIVVEMVLYSCMGVVINE